MDKILDLLVENEVIKKCFKCEHVLYGNLRIVYNSATFMIVLWNKFQIFVYEDRNLEDAAKIFVPEFQIHELILSNNYILCLDSNGNVHTISLKFKNPAQKRLKSSFQPRQQSITACFHVQDHALSIKYDAHSIYLCLYKINTEFYLEKKVELKYANPWPLPKPVLGKCLLTSYQINEQHFDQINQLYNVKIMPKDCSIVFMSFDKVTIFSCLFSSKMSEDEVNLIKIHTFPSEINRMEVMDDLKLLVCLTAGTIIQFYLKDTSKDPTIIHLNVAIYKYLIMNETFIYTDGVSMWRSDKTFSDDITFRQFIIKHVKDFVKCGDQVICTTYSNLIYNISLEDETSYLKTNEYCTAEKLLNNAEYLYKILEEVERNNDLVKKVREEGNYITVLSLSNRQDIMDTIIQHNIIVYENYDDVIKDHSELLLTDEMSDYFENDAVLFVVKISTKSLQQTFSNILANLFNDLQIHLSFFSQNKLLKTTSLKLKESFKKIGILTSLNVKNSNTSQVNVIIKLISSIPGCHDRKQPLWSCLYEKHVTLKSEHFIKTNTSTANNTSLKKSRDLIENLVYKLENNYHRQLFKFVDVSKQNSNVSDWSMYLKLPPNYIDLFKHYNIIENFSENKANYLIKQYTSKEFLESKSDLILEIGNEKAKVQIVNDFSPLLKVSSEDISIAHNIRDFFSRLIYKDFQSQDGTSREYVKYTLYNVTENLQKEIKSCLVQRPSSEAFKTIAEHFERSVIGAIPM